MNKQVSARDKSWAFLLVCCHRSRQVPRNVDEWFVHDSAYWSPGTWLFLCIDDYGNAANVFSMSKDQTTMLKGIAILMMLFLHLFSNPGFADTTTPLLWIGEIPFATVFTRACGPVGFFLVCSGYGLAYSHLHGRLNSHDQLRRVVRLYLNYWLILSIFVGLGSIFIPEYYPGSLGMLVENYTGWNTDGYDHPAWFLLPYCVLCLTSPAIFRVIDKVGMAISVIGSFILTFASMYMISHYIAPANAHHEWYAFVLTYIDLLFPFVIGSLICYRNHDGTVEIKGLKSHQYRVYVLLILWFTIHCFVETSALDPIFLCLFMLLFVNWDIKGWCKRILLELGRKSMVMWLVHAFVYGRFFHDFIYGFKYPLLIFTALVVSSYLLSVPIMYLSGATIGKIAWLSKKS